MILCVYAFLVYVFFILFSVQAWASHATGLAEENMGWLGARIHSGLDHNHLAQMQEQASGRSPNFHEPRSDISCGRDEGSGGQGR